MGDPLLAFNIQVKSPTDIETIRIIFLNPFRTNKIKGIRATASGSANIM